MVIAIKGVWDLVSRASLQNMKTPTIEIRTREPYCTPTYDCIISAPENFFIEKKEGDENGEVSIHVQYHGEWTKAYLSKGSYENISIFEGDYFVEKGKENV